ncbi:hypothetical protein [Planctomyces sp. SH-PL62]|uniref:hypothetical protein n=1 Tax=Planctomyces sp. SH-PL62 TaxID=1636152 RepID=UPI00078D4B04|nr:hypothetical protein [Planctomyces sp. SH-PL62]AMV37413.1 hypothetical protein VT85_08260 [Planctomyces sp. SH-PL62]
MELTFECAHCKMIDHTEDVEAKGRALCRHCHAARDLAPSAFDAEGGVVGCPLCGAGDLYVRKDFPQALGLAIVLAGFAVSTVFWYDERPLSAYLVLGSSLLLDMVLYRWVPDVAVCYRCSSQLRGPGLAARGLGAFDLAVAERYRQERFRAEALKARGASAGPGAGGDAG